MNSKFYLVKTIAAISIAICSVNCLSFAEDSNHFPQIKYAMDSKLNMPNPVASLTEEQALKIAKELGDGKDMGSWKTMSGEEFMRWWRSCHKDNVSLLSTNPNFNMPNPVASLTEEQALEIAKELGDGKDMGSWRTMSGEEFMRWWRSCHKDNVSLLSMDSSNLVEVNGLSYFIDDENSCARVVGLSKDSDITLLSGFSKKSIRIESSISYNGRNYSVTSIDDSCFEGCSDLYAVIVPNSIEKIGARSFAESSLKYLIFEHDSKINSIRESAFENSSIEFISLPKSLAFIDRSAFSNCKNLLVLMVENPDLNVSADSFNNCENLSHVFVPCNIKNKDIGYSGLKIGDSGNFDVMNCSYSKFGLATQKKVGSGTIHFNHEFSDWTKVENENSKMRTCALCNLAEIAVENGGNTASV